MRFLNNQIHNLLNMLHCPQNKKPKGVHLHHIWNTYYLKEDTPIVLLLLMASPY